jgi:hypothetical protein
MGSDLPFGAAIPTSCALRPWRGAQPLDTQPMLPHLHGATLDLFAALHAWMGFERAQGNWGDAEFGVAVGREVAFGGSPYAWPAPRVARIALLDPTYLVESDRLTAHGRLQRAALHGACVAAWRGWEHRLAQDVPALWPALAMPRFTLHFNSDAQAFSAFRLNFLKCKTNLGTKHEEDNTMPFTLFADRLVGILFPLAKLPKATGLWALGGPTFLTNRSQNTFGFQGPVMAGSGPTEAAVAAATLNAPVRGPDVPTLVDKFLANGFAPLPSMGAQERARMQAKALLQTPSAGVV